MNTIATSEIEENYKTTIPKKVRSKVRELNDENTILDWKISENNEIIIKPREKIKNEKFDGIIKIRQEF